jgi:RND family efflux transporter MFP subunit
MTRTHAVLVAAAIGLAASLALSGCGGHDAGGAPHAKADSGEARRPVAATPSEGTLLAAADVAPARRADLRAGVPVSGTLVPGWEARVTSPLDDIVEEVVVREGQAVARGQVLARFRSLTVAADAASGAAALKVAAADWERQKRLLAAGAVSERDVEAAEAQYRAAEAQNAMVSRRLSDATVRAPGAGVVVSRFVQSGDRVGTGDPLFTVASTATLEFEATVPSEYVSLVRPGAAVDLDVTGSSERVSGKVARVNATADAATRQVKVYVNVPNPGGRLVGGLFASGNVVTRESRKAIAVPTAGVRREGDATFALVVESGRIARRDLRVGVADRAQDLVEVLEGLREGDVVVTGSIEGLAPGTPVHVQGEGR